MVERLLRARCRSGAARLPGRGRCAAGAGRAGRAARDGRERYPHRQPGALGGCDERLHGVARGGALGVRRGDPGRLLAARVPGGRVLRAGVRRVGGGPDQVRRGGPRGVRAHRPRPEGPADGDRPRQRRRALRARPRERRARGARVRRHRVVKVPASSANLGPGYDVLAAAISPSLELDVEETGEFFVHCDVPGVPADRSNLFVPPFDALHPPDGISFQISSEIPPAAGLGSSAAAIVAGLAAADHIFELDAPPLDLAAELEGHPDNVGAALNGGFVVCADDGPPVRFDPVPGLEGVLAIPAEQVSTVEARAALPAEVPIADAVHNTAHAALLVLGLARGDLDLVARGLSDRIHQQRRASLYPRSMELLASARELGAIGASISGAGPAVLFWCDWQQTGALFERLRAEARDCEVRRARFAPGGADVRAL